MADHSGAEEDLRVIRTLMERATIYRAISAPTALVGGLLSILAAVLIELSSRPNGPLGHTINSREFVFVWLGVLVLTLITNVFVVWREARNSGRPFVSSGMKLALRAIAPNLIVPALFTVWFLKLGYLGAVELQLVVVWVVFYGLALLSTGLFAPRSLVILGWVVLLTGVSVPVMANAVEGLSDNAPNFVMGLTFGLYHVIYALFTWSRKRPPASHQSADE
jgi:magnesium-transporting ATPase (P-type)